MTQQEREAWALAYRVYDQYSRALRQAAGMDDDGETARKLFEAAGDQLSKFYSATDDGGRLIALAVYGILSEVYTSARKAVKKPQERAEHSGSIDIALAPGVRQIA